MNTNLALKIASYIELSAEFHRQAGDTIATHEKAAADVRASAESTADQLLAAQVIRPGARDAVIAELADPKIAHAHILRMATPANAGKAAAQGTETPPPRMGSAANPPQAKTASDANSGSFDKLAFTRNLGLDDSYADFRSSRR